MLDQARVNFTIILVVSRQFDQTSVGFDLNVQICRCWIVRTLVHVDGRRSDFLDQLSLAVETPVLNPPHAISVDVVDQDVLARAVSVNGFDTAIGSGVNRFANPVVVLVRARVGILKVVNRVFDLTAVSHDLTCPLVLVVAEPDTGNLCQVIIADQIGVEIGITGWIVLF